MSENQTNPDAPQETAAPTETSPAPNATATTPQETAPAAKAAPKPKKRDALTVKAEIDALHDLATQITEGRTDQIEALIADRKKAKALKLTFKTGTHLAVMLGVTASSTAGEVPAMRNWANAARRKINQLEVELR